jgi:hypothetical protein
MEAQMHIDLIGLSGKKLLPNLKRPKYPNVRMRQLL